MFQSGYLCCSGRANSVPSPRIVSLLASQGSPTGGSGLSRQARYLFSRTEHDACTLSLLVCSVRVKAHMAQALLFVCHFQRVANILLHRMLATNTLCNPMLSYLCMKNQTWRCSQGERGNLLNLLLPPAQPSQRHPCTIIQLQHTAHSE
jgi:hypothetical protein